MLEGFEFCCACQAGAKWCDLRMLRHACAGVAEGNALENVLAWLSLVRPSVQFGCTLQDALGSRPNSAELQVRTGRTSLLGSVDGVH